MVSKVQLPKQVEPDETHLGTAITSSDMRTRNNRKSRKNVGRKLRKLVDKSGPSFNNDDNQATLSGPDNEKKKVTRKRKKDACTAGRIYQEENDGTYNEKGRRRSKEDVEQTAGRSKSLKTLKKPKENSPIIIPAASSSTSAYQNLISSSESEDEWVDVEENTEYLNRGCIDHDVEITIKEGPQVESEESKAARYLRLEVNRRIKERQINCHKMHLLCYIAHLKFWVRNLMRNEFLKPLCFSIIPDGYVTAALHSFDVSLAERFLKWLTSVFISSEVTYYEKERSSSAKVERLEKLISDKVYEDDRDLALITFLFFSALKQSVRLVLSCQPTPLKVNLDDLIGTKNTRDMVLSGSVLSCTAAGNAYKLGKKSTSGEKKYKNDNGNKRKKNHLEKITFKRNYWIEYWDEVAERWICVDPWTKTVDLPTAMEDNVTSPMHYVLAVDDDFGVRDVTSRYASRYLYHDVRRLRVDSDWWQLTVKLFRSRNRVKERLEDVEMHNYLMALPMPTNIADFKNHPLYVLKKDLLKFEAIYPPDQQPIGKVRNVDVYPRSCVYHLEGPSNWIKRARSIKPGEKPYKVVKARPDIRIPKEERQSDKTLDLFGYWQTEPYIPPKVINGRIPRNEHGNLYLYKKSMLPEGCVYLRLDGLYGIARRLNFECVPCVVGWEFHKNGNHPIIDGYAVLKEDEQRIRDVWSEEFEKKAVRARQRCKERAKKNWRRLYRGVILMKRVKAKFAFDDKRAINADEQFGSCSTEENIEDSLTYAWPRTEFNLPLTEDSLSE